MIKFSVLSSGSKGNCTYIEINNHKYLLDIGTNFLYTNSKLKELDVDFKDIEGIFITHLHIDHIGGLKRFLKEHDCKVYLTEKMFENITDKPNNAVIYEDIIPFDGYSIETIKLSHDTPDCRGYIFSDNNSSLVYITDTGYINKKYFDKLKNRTAYILESNHDVDMLMNSKRFYPLKMRILGDEGHICNKDCAYYLSNFIGDSTKMVILAHLSEECNTPELAYNETVTIINDKDLLIAKQNERTELIEL